MSSRPELRIDWCTNAAAKYACEKWHYSRCTFTGKQARIGVWESGVFIGAIVFAPGACPQLVKPYGLSKYEGCELFRVALAEHKTPVSRIMAIAIRFIKREYPKLRLLVSFADPAQGHHGGIYQATNWIYAGTSGDSEQYLYKGKWTHPKTFRSRWANRYHVDLATLPKRNVPGKHRYLMPLDDDMRKQVEPLRKPYPKRARSADSGTPGVQSGGGGANPTRALLNDSTEPEEVA